MEVCVDTLESCVNAVSGGASRIELCSALSEGGLTPSIGFLKMAKKLVKIPIHVLLRPRGAQCHFSLFCPLAFKALTFERTRFRGTRFTLLF
jgi:copper homeostasis protein